MEHFNNDDLECVGDYYHDDDVPDFQGQNSADILPQQPSHADYHDSDFDVDDEDLLPVRLLLSHFFLFLSFYFIH